MTGSLYMVATPIGNLDDITFRALETLKKVDFVLAEDTRVVAKLLKHFEIKKPVVSYHQHSNENKKLEILTLLVQGRSLALVADAGTPGISDPGNELIDYLLEKEPNIKIIPIPGVSAITAALSVCGFRADKFVFLGFLPKKKRGRLFKWLKEGRITFAMYESPHRILKTLEVLLEAFGGEKRALVAREMTKLYESLYRGQIKDIISNLEESKIKGEIVIVIEG